MLNTRGNIGVSCVSWTAYLTLDVTQQERCALDGQRPEASNKDDRRKYKL